MYIDLSISQGQQEARTRWGTHESGAAFDRKKRTFLTGEAREFVAQQVMCVVVGPDQERRPCGLLLAGSPGFVDLPDEHTCLIPIDRRYERSCFVQGLRGAFARGALPRLALCFMQHITRQRLCVQGEVEVMPGLSSEFLWLRMQVNLAFFHCPKYIRTSVAGLHVEQAKTYAQLTGHTQDRLTEGTRAFLAKQVLCYLCTMDRHGQCAVNHRGGAAGFLLTLASDRMKPGGVVLLPDYAGNGAFEAIGNILETRRAALLVPGYADQLALCIIGDASVLEPARLSTFLREKCRGAQRVVAIAAQHIEQQDADWSEALAHERMRMRVLAETKQLTQSCQL